MARNVVILGGHGDGLVVAEAIRVIKSTSGSLNLQGCLNDAMDRGTRIDDISVLGRWDEWRSLPSDVMFVPVIHKVGQMVQRAARMRSLAIPPARLATVIHPAACIAGGVTIGPGCFIASNVTVQPGAKIEACVSIRAGANVGHDAHLHEFAYMGANSTLCGRAVLREGAHLGPNSAVLEDRIVGRFAVVGLCSAVLKNVDDFSTVIGNPARTLSALAAHRDR
jgi:sugar O-acyltransferase (sialic acid O-acetyltransferase NeuD family)